MAQANAPQQPPHPPRRPAPQPVPKPVPQAGKPAPVITDYASI